MQNMNTQLAADAKPETFAAANGIRPPSRRGRKSVWQPVRPELTLFMTYRVNCPACRLSRQAAGLPRDGHLHVRLVGGDLTVTEIDDIHRPGKRLLAKHWAAFGAAQLFRLENVQIDRDERLPAAGIATLGWLDGRRRLNIVGAAEGFKSHGDVLFDAIEDVN